ncbi:MAG: hypothetical protein GWN61_05620 [candidate division Zixibacteria bacterium]|nr:RDD family protein [candidate division Zixibacteria bacterium]NIS45503.1 RDD family protein [candidate division Zixibacteria bacterium]NIU13635.1 RDD family protein [candidate division Zixibacteria bacterium]NIV05670.1 hypothetical protein [candidate division Zixibacteria bacterium]NIW44509.1 hypothetical protein [Gammaproteobacteria bacterium]
METRITETISEDFLGYYAGFSTRLAAFIIDAVVVAILSVSISWFVSIVGSMFQAERIFTYILGYLPGAQDVYNMVLGPTVLGVITFIAVVLYHSFFWAVTGQTPGKAIMGIRVLTTQGKSIPFWRAVLRYFGFFISTAPFFLGFLWVLVDERRQAFHDKMTGTYVVYTWHAKPDEKFLTEYIQKIHRRRRT